VYLLQTKFVWHPHELDTVELVEYWTVRQSRQTLMVGLFDGIAYKGLQRHDEASLDGICRGDLQTQFPEFIEG
jgi:hypothetical protein